MRVFYLASSRREPIIGVIGALQYDIIASRLKNEYGVTTEIGPQEYEAAR